MKGDAGAWAALTLARQGDKSAVPRLLKFLRKSLGWSGAEFARNLHVDPATVSRWESPRAAQTMSASNELLLRLAVAHSNQMADYEVDKLAEVAVEAARPLKITIRQKKTGWKTQEAA